DGPFVPTNVTVRITGGSLAAPVDIALNPASTTTGLAITDLATQVNGNAQLQAAGISVRGVPGGPLTFTDARGEIFSVEAAGDTADGLGLGSFVADTGGSVDYTSIQGTAYDNTVSAGTAHLEFSIDGGPSIAIPGIDLSGGSGADLAPWTTRAFREPHTTIRFRRAPRTWSSPSTVDLPSPFPASTCRGEMPRGPIPVPAPISKKPSTTHSPPIRPCRPPVWWPRSPEATSTSRPATTPISASTPARATRPRTLALAPKAWHSHRP